MRLQLIRKKISILLCMTLLIMFILPVQLITAATLNTANEWAEDFESFTTAATFGTSGNGDTQFGWKSNAGTNPWGIVQDGASKALKVTNPSTASTTVFIGGTGSYVFDATDVLVSADIKVVTTGTIASPSGQVGIDARQASNSDYYSLVIKNGNLQLLKRTSSTTAIITQQPIPNFTANKYYTLTLLVKGSRLIGSIAGGPTLTVTDTSITTASTKVGVNATSSIEAYIDNFHAMKVFPNAPTGLTAVAAVDNQINLTWSGAVGAEQYTVKRSTTSGGPYTTIATVTDGVYTDNRVINGTQYYYVVSSVAKANNEDYIDGLISSELPVKALASTQAPPAAPTQFHGTPGDGQASLSWNAVDQITGYHIKRSLVSGGPYGAETVVGTVYPTLTSFMDTGLNTSSTYYYVVSAFNSKGESPNSSEVSLYIAPALDAPENLTAIPGYNSAKLQWQPVVGAISYVVKRASTSNGAYSIVASNVTDTTYTDSNLQNGTTYFYIVQDVNASSIHSANSNEAAATPQMKYELDDTQITASSYDGTRDQDPASGNKQVNVKDDLTTRWGADGKGQWIQFDLGKISSIGCIGIAFYKGNERSYFFQVQASSDAVTWHTLYNGNSSGAVLEMENFDLPDTDARYVRIIGNGNSATDYNGYTVVHLYSPNPNGLVNAPYSQGTPVTPRSAVRPSKAGLYNPDGTVHVLPEPNKVVGRTLNVKDTAYGAKGDGVSDDRAAIQKAVDNAQPGDEVYLPNGVYKLLSAHPTDANSHIRLKTGVNVRGESREGAVLLSDMDNGFGPPNDTGHVTSTGITAGSGRVLLIFSLNNIVISNLTITSTWNNTYSTDPGILSPTSGGPKTGIYIDQANAASPGPNNIVIDNVITEKFQQMGIRLSKASDVTVRNSIFRKATDIGPSGSGYGISIQGKPKDDHYGMNDDSLNALVENNFFDGTVALRHGVIIEYYSHNNVVRNNQFSSTTLDSIDLHGENEYLNEVYGNTIEGVRRGAGVGLGNTGGGFPSNHSESGPYNYIHDNTIRNSAEGISLTMNSPDTIIENNKIELDDTLIRTNDNQDIIGISILNAPRSIVRGNIIQNFTKTDHPIVADYDIGDTNANFVGAGDPRDIQLIGNTIVGNANGIKIIKGSGMFMQDNHLNNTLYNVDNSSGNVVYDSLIHVSEDAWVEAANPQQNYGTGSSDKAKNLTVKSSGSVNGIAYFKYDLSGMNGKTNAALQLSGKLTDSNPGDETVVLSVYGLNDSSWSENTINWSNSPNHSPGSADVAGEGQTAFYLGSFTMKGYKVDSYDISTKALSDFVLAKQGGMATFMVVDSKKQGINLEIYAKEKEFESLRPALKLASSVSMNPDSRDTPTVIPNTKMDPISAIKSEIKIVDGKQVALAQVDDQIIDAALKNSSSGKLILTVDASVNVDQTRVTLTNNALQKVAAEAAIKSLRVQTKTGSYELPAKQIHVQDLAAKLGVSMDQITVEVTIGRNAAAAEKARASGQEVLGAVEFTVKVMSTDGKMVEISSFSQYVPRFINTETVLAGRPMAAVRVETDNSGNALYQPVPFTVSGTEATIYSRTNSTYLLLENNVTFADVNHHWAKNDIERMASKMIVQGVSKADFLPDQAVTRAEFAALIARTIGLNAVASPKSRFADVRSSDWFEGQVYAAAEAGIVTGYEDQTFHPNQSISRQEMAVMIYRAMNFAGYTNSSNPGEKITFADEQLFGNWARESIYIIANNQIVEGVASGKFDPAAMATRAQSSVILSRMLSKLQFTN
ncbi:S-layer homology domain-containing protein [Paenibacillus alba]|uniref:S-layer homology domain-containing protein n=1 Tax=Paenibacillus alba TaxID=1197127 RepID=A0ABU6G228_9BACL|nr:S-layer homology domain-containing protein [Paenibacillus alba]MEC0228202.1 S-layer homology domain-containing protein [Paenibacillus alba]